MPPTSEATGVTTGHLAGRSFGFGQLGGVPLARFTLATDGAIRGSRHPNEFTWRVDESGDVVFVDPTGRVTTRFTTVGTANGQLVLAGEFLDTGVVHFLNTPARPGDPTPPPPAALGHEPPGLDDLTTPVWGLGRLGDAVVADLFVIADGRVRGSGSTNEARWELTDDGRLLFLSANGQMTTSFDTLVTTSRGHAWVGPFGDGQTIHYLVPLFSPKDPDAVPPQVARSIEQSEAQGEPGPSSLSRERYVQARRHLFSLAGGNVLPAAGVESEARVAALRKAFDEALGELGIDPEAQFRASVKGSDSTALFDYVAEAKPATCLQVGTNAGFSTLLVADALRRGSGGHLTVIDPEIPQAGGPAPVDAARRVLERLGLGELCSFVRGWASAMTGEPAYERWKRTVPVVGQSMLAELGSIDLAVVDADDSLAATVADFMLVKDTLADDAVVAFCGVLGRLAVTDAVETILGDLQRGQVSDPPPWDVDVNTGPDGLVALRRRPPPPSPALTVEVVDSTNDTPVVGAHVTVIGYGTAVTSNRGEATFFHEVPGGTVLETLAPGYRRQRTSLAEPTHGRAVRADVRLHPN